MKILHRFNNTTLFEDNSCTTIKQLVELAVSKDADLRGADLRGADLRGADLGGVNLGGVNLRGVNLRSANLGGVNLRGVNLVGADLRGANLRGADLVGANLRGANLGGVNLGGVNLRGAYLGGANLGGADLRSAKLPEPKILIPTGELIVYKKTRDSQYNRLIVTLKVPADAKRSCAFTNKCRAERAEVVAFSKPVDEAISMHNSEFKYRIGETVLPDKFDENWWMECSGGIHFFLTKEEAEAY